LFSTEKGEENQGESRPVGPKGVRIFEEGIQKKVSLLHWTGVKRKEATVSKKG